MLELGIKTSKFSAQIKFDINTQGQPKSKGQTFELQAKSNQINKRLILLENDSMLQASLSDMVNEPAIYHLRLARLTKNFFLSRMLKKIGSKFDLQKKQNLSEEEIKAHWNKYDSFFKTKYHHADYEYYIRQVEAKQTPTHAQQLRNAQLWMSKKR